eukprot:NODE_1956_length_1737_cov_138.573110_g1666_i0.p1 GENE.NODE_1956_length_1737_cov_138.573110_g1666_i0~~NODE_1956_length_1737_cov_138.573110_g1666_i0.p1  ORF type:complete len:496 (-),score=63.47 NODE_1956_length_1737_cov_138.573110_g1666_i0:181-1668(-)
MVVLAAAILTKTGKSLLSRQFVEMSRIRIEGLLSAFPKLMGSGKQYTYFETDTVRYVYQPIENLFLVLITNRSSNIVEDLETLRLLGRIVPEHCQNLEEEEVSKSAFNILFAFDEVIQLGYRENLTLEQVKTFLEMDSSEEKLANAIKQSKVTDATQQANDIARQLQKAKKSSGSSFNSNGLSSKDYTAEVKSPTIIPDEPKPSTTSSASKSKGGMTLAKKGGKEDLLSKMVKAGELEDTRVVRQQTASAPAHVANITLESVHLKVEEKISAVLNRDGGFQSLEVNGNLFLSINDSSNASIRISLNREHNENYAWKTHPNLNKNVFTKDRVLALKDSKPFPTGSNLGILRWRLQNPNSFKPPISVNCWPSDNNITVEYEVERTDLVLNQVVITIPLGGANPSVENVDYGDHRYDPMSQTLSWTLDRIESGNNQGSMEISLDRSMDSSVFFPVSISFYGESTLANIAVTDVLSIETGNSTTYSSEVVLSTERYEVV